VDHNDGEFLPLPSSIIIRGRNMLDSVHEVCFFGVSEKKNREKSSVR